MSIQKFRETKNNFTTSTSSVGSYTAFKKVGNLLYISGQISLEPNGNLIKGKVGSEMSLKDGKKLLRYVV